MLLFFFVIVVVVAVRFEDPVGSLHSLAQRANGVR